MWDSYPEHALPQICHKKKKNNAEKPGFIRVIAD
jgi:hypothetical protein